MAGASKKGTGAAVIELAGQTFCEELRIAVERNTPAALFRTLCFSLLASTRIGHQIAVDAARALADSGWTTPKKMAGSTWRQRTDVLNRAGYARYDESTSRMLGDTIERLLAEYGGDLRGLRAAANQDVDAERRLLKEFKGVGDVGADIFFREVQVAWDELFPFADERALTAAGRLGLGTNADELRKLVRGKREYARLVAGLVRIELENGYDRVEQAI